MKLKVNKSKSYNPAKKAYGFAATVKSNGSVSFDELAEEAGHNTSMNPAEVEACAKLFVQACVNEIKKGMIVDLGPLGKLYPACTSGWVENAEELTLDQVKPHVNYTPSEDIKAAILGASLSFARADETDESQAPAQGSGSGSNAPASGSNGGSNGGSNSGSNGGSNSGSSDSGDDAGFD